MTIKLYKKLMLSNSIYYGHNYINCMQSDFQQAFINIFGNNSKSAEGENISYEDLYLINSSRIVDNNQDINANNNQGINNNNNQGINNNGNNIDNNLINSINFGNHINIHNNQVINNTNNIQRIITNNIQRIITNNNQDINDNVNNIDNNLINKINFGNLINRPNNKMINTNNKKKISNTNNIKMINTNNIKNDNINFGNLINISNKQVINNTNNIQKINTNNIKINKINFGNIINIPNIQDIKNEKTFLNKKRKNVSKKPRNADIVCKIFTNCNKYLIDYLNYLLPYEAHNYDRFIKIKPVYNLNIKKCKEYFSTMKVCDVIPNMSTSITTRDQEQNQKLYNDIMEIQGDVAYDDIKYILCMTFEKFYYKIYICKKEDGTYDKISPFSNFIKNLKKNEDYKDHIKKVGYDIDNLFKKIKFRNNTKKKSNKSLIQKSNIKCKSIKNKKSKR